jgi:Flp pilus assembly pilin Flp
MIELLKKFWQEEQGQDLIEYTLLLAFVALVSAALFIGAGQSASQIWTVANGHLSNAAASAAAGGGGGS